MAAIRMTRLWSHLRRYLPTLTAASHGSGIRLGRQKVGQGYSVWVPSMSSAEVRDTVRVALDEWEEAGNRRPVILDEPTTEGELHLYCYVCSEADEARHRAARKVKAIV